MRGFMFCDGYDKLMRLFSVCSEKNAERGQHYCAF